MEKPKYLCIRMLETLHRKAKLQSCKEGLSLQDWIEDAIIEKLIREGVIPRVDSPPDPA